MLVNKLTPKDIAKDERTMKALRERFGGASLYSEQNNGAVGAEIISTDPGEIQVVCRIGLRGQDIQTSTKDHDGNLEFSLTWSDDGSARAKISRGSGDSSEDISGCWSVHTLDDQSNGSGAGLVSEEDYTSCGIIELGFIGPGRYVICLEPISGNGSLLPC